MVSRRDLWLAIPQQLRALPADLAAVTIGILCTLGAVFIPRVNDTPLRVLFGLPFVLFLPGYAFIAALFPEAGTSLSTPAEGDATTDDKTQRAQPQSQGRQPQPTPTRHVTLAASDRQIGLESMALNALRCRLASQLRLCRSSGLC